MRWEIRACYHLEWEAASDGREISTIYWIIIDIIKMFHGGQKTLACNKERQITDLWRFFVWKFHVKSWIIFINSILIDFALIACCVGGPLKKLYLFIMSFSFHNLYRYSKDINNNETKLKVNLFIYHACNWGYRAMACFYFPTFS